MEEPTRQQLDAVDNVERGRRPGGSDPVTQPREQGGQRAGARTPFDIADGVRFG
jgi:hypothetical protein